MTNVTIKKTITQPEAAINAFADSLGYQEVIANESYEPAVGSKQIVDPEWERPADWEVTDEEPMVDNPDHVPEVGTKTIPNPETRTEFVSRKFDAVAAEWFSQFAERDATVAAEAVKKETIKQTVEGTKAAIKQTISTEM